MLIITKVVSSNPAEGEVYSIQHYVINFDSNLRQVGGFLQVLLFPPSIKLSVFENGIKHHNLNPSANKYMLMHFNWNYNKAI